MPDPDLPPTLPARRPLVSAEESAEFLTVATAHAADAARSVAGLRRMRERLAS